MEQQKAVAGLMKTEVVLKSVRIIQSSKQNMFNENRGCIEIRQSDEDYY